MADPSPLSTLPGVDTLVSAATGLVERHGRRATTDAVRCAVDKAREAAQNGHPVPDPAALLHAAAEDLSARRPGPPRSVLNAAGIVVHTNLGRAPLSLAARDALLDAAGYCDLEYDLGTGERGSRGARLEPLLAEACGADAGIAVNNAAAALLLVLGALAGGREVIVSRGELVEIGGSFRLPEVMAASGAKLVEVGTTNRTRAADFAAALEPTRGRPQPDVALLLAVHPSNYRITGFTQAPALAELASIAHEHGIPLVHDTGSGLLSARNEPWLAAEPSVRGSLADGADLVLCSADKLLGGPQAGLLVGRADLVERCRRSPLARALRLDKLRVAALYATLEAHLRGALEEVPVWAALTTDAAVLAGRAAALAERVGGEVTEGITLVGGGAAPDVGLTSPLVRIAPPAPSRVARRLRTGDPPVIGRVDGDALLLDLRAVPPDADKALGEAVAAALLDHP